MRSLLHGHARDPSPPGDLRHGGPGRANLLVERHRSLGDPAARLRLTQQLPRGARAARGVPGTLDAPPPVPRLDPADGLEAVLRALYGWYRETARMAENVRRDRLSAPALDE